MSDEEIMKLAESISGYPVPEIGAHKVLAFARAIAERQRSLDAEVCEEDAKSNALAPIEKYRALYLADAIRGFGDEWKDVPFESEIKREGAI